MVRSFKKSCISSQTFIIYSYRGSLLDKYVYFFVISSISSSTVLIEVGFCMPEDMRFIMRFSHLLGNNTSARLTMPGISVLDIWRGKFKQA